MRAMLALLLLALGLRGAPAQIPEHPVKAAAAVAPASARPGETVRLTVTATIDTGYHIYAMNQPPAPEGPGPVATKITLKSTPALDALGEWVEPPTKIKFDKGFERDVAVLYGPEALFTREFRIPADAPAGPLEVEVTFRHQACTETGCLNPKNLKSRVQLTILAGDGPAPTAQPLPTGAPPAETPAATATKATEPTPAPTPTPTAAPQNQSGPTAAAASTGSTTPPPATGAASVLSLTPTAFLVTCFIGGLVSLLTPCVFPMIPITISFFTKRASKTRREAIMLASVYSGTIVLGFALFGFGVSLVLRAFGAGTEASGFITQVASNPWLNIVLGGLFVAFALSLFGVFEISLPSGLANRLQGAKGNRTDVVGAMFMACIFVVVSFTCTAPLMGPLLVSALAGEWTRPFFGMTAYAVGFALPFFFLALSPSLLSALPKSGGWLYSVKVVMGLLEIAAALKFFSVADLVFDGAAQFFSRELLLASWAVIAAATALYLFQRIRLPHDTPEETVGPMRLVLGMGFATIALVMGNGLIGGRVPSMIDSYLPPDVESAAASTRRGGAETAKKLEWLAEYDLALAEAQRTGKPIFLDFTGYSCTNCRLMEKEMFTRQDVDSRLREYVLVKLWTDDETHGERHQQFQIERFGTVSLPYHVVLDSRGNKIDAREYTRDAADYVAFLQRGIEENKARTIAMK
jgi:thiol:disulfide interchange protein DsbD